MECGDTPDAAAVAAPTVAPHAQVRLRMAGLSQTGQSSTGQASTSRKDLETKVLFESREQKETVISKLELQRDQLQQLTGFHGNCGILSMAVRALAYGAVLGATSTVSLGLSDGNPHAISQTRADTQAVEDYQIQISNLQLERAALEEEFTEFMSSMSTYMDGVESSHPLNDALLASIPEMQAQLNDLAGEVVTEHDLHCESGAQESDSELPAMPFRSEGLLRVATVLAAGAAGVLDEDATPQPPPNCESSCNSSCNNCSPSPFNLFTVEEIAQPCFDGSDGRGDGRFAPGDIDGRYYVG
jgi:hypothetical protein